ncbi:uncharacterized protein LOC142578117 isoform X3 [Dermacentor variabilis]|uniref:uncharacterized protein LOC142578117 isoform X3 n=1 Tax=Dermacentor variabilis TaxID=34621 RepID=UPI003F5C5E6B
MATSGASDDGGLTRKTRMAKKREAYFAWAEYLHSVAELTEMEEKVQSAVDKTKASRLNYVCEIAEAMKEEKYLKAQIAYSKAAVTNKDDLATLITHGDIDDLKDDFAEQNREHLDAAVEVIRNTKPTDRAKLGSSLLAVAENGGALRHLPLANASEAHRKFAKVTQVTAQELSRIASLKKEVTESCRALEFLVAVQGVFQDKTLDSKYDTVLDLESLDLS